MTDQRSQDDEDFPYLLLMFVFLSLLWVLLNLLPDPHQPSPNHPAPIGEMLDEPDLKPDNKARNKMQSGGMEK